MATLQPNPLPRAAAVPEVLTWSSAPKQFKLGPVVLGPIRLEVVDWTIPKVGHPRMFNFGLLEWFTCAHPASLVVIYLPIAAFLLWRGLAVGWTPLAAVGLFAGGLALWTLLEYLIHRFSFHFTPRNQLSVVLAFLIHGVHHARPEDDKRWVTPPVLSLPIAALLYVGFRAAFGRSFDPVFGGVMLGYMLYDVLHYLIHRGALTSRLGRYLRKNHYLHHYVTPERRFGVSTPLWDYVFRTNK